MPNTAKSFYYLKDHLGSIRVVINEAGEIVNSDDYDLLGMILNGRSTDTAYLNVKYKFTGKERDTETGYDYFGARYYDSRFDLIFNLKNPQNSLCLLLNYPSKNSQTLATFPCLNR